VGKSRSGCLSESRISERNRRSAGIEVEPDNLVGCLAAGAYFQTLRLDALSQESIAPKMSALRTFHWEYCYIEANDTADLGVLENRG